MNNKNQNHHHHHHLNPITISTSTPISTINSTNITAHHTTKTSNSNTNHIQAALHAIERFTEQARSQQQQPPHSSNSPASSTSTTSIHQKLTSRTSNSNLELGFRTMNIAPPGLPNPSQKSNPNAIQTSNSPNTICKPITNSMIGTNNPDPSQVKTSLSPPRKLSKGIEDEVTRNRNRSGSDTSSNISLIDHEPPSQVQKQTQVLDQMNENGSKPIKTRSSRGGRRKSSKSNPITDSPPNATEATRSNIINEPEADRPIPNSLNDLKAGLKLDENGKADGNLPKEETRSNENKMNKKVNHMKSLSVHSTVPDQLKTTNQETIPSSKTVSDDLLKIDSSSVLSKIISKLESLPLNDQLSIKRTLKSIPNPIQSGYPLQSSWRLFFSDSSLTIPSSSSSNSNSMKSNQLKASEYQSGMSVVFDRIESVENLCESLMGFKKFMGIRLKGIGLMGLEKPGCGIGLVGFRAQQNLHFFRVGVGPVWEDPWNSKGGRLTISLNISILDRIFETLILLTAGGVIEDETDYKGKITGIVGSRRSRGDRIEIWLSGNRLGESPNEDWIKDVIGCLGREIGNEVGGIKYKKHL